MKRTLAILFTVVLLVSMVLIGAGCKTVAPTATVAPVATVAPAATDAAAATATPAPTADAKDFKVGFIYVGPIGDGGFTYSQDQGRLYLEKTLGVSTEYVENVPESADCTAAMENLINAKGCKVIFATSYGYGPFMDALATKYPNVIFEHCSGDVLNATNLGNYFGKIEQARYLTGIAAGKATKTGKIGYVAAFPIPECIRGIDAFTLGVRSVNPTATVQVVWTSTWYDPVKEKQAAESLLSTGCDVTAQHQDSPTAVAAAEAVGAFSTGYNTSMLSSAPKGYLTSPVWNWGPFFAQVVTSAMNGTFKPEKYWGGLDTGTVGVDENFGPSVTQDTKDLIKATQDKLKDGSLNVFAGPIKLQDGSELVASGATLADSDVWTLSKFVDGVIGTTK